MAKQETATKQITVQGLTAVVLAPYAEGHVVTEAEAAALNQVRAENIRNNTARMVKAAIKEAEVEDAEGLSEEKVTELLQAIETYDKEYEFNMASVGGGRTPTDPVEVEAKKIAKQLINAQLKEQGKKVGDVDKDKYAAAVATVAAREDIRQRAAEAIDARKAAAETALEGLNL